MTILLDTCVLIDVIRQKNKRAELLHTLALSNHAFSVSAINVAEVYAGMRPEERRRTESFLSGLHCYAISAEIAQLAGELKSAWARQGRTIDLADMLIAATALKHQVPLMTDTCKDFSIPELSLYPLSPRGTQ